MQCPKKVVCIHRAVRGKRRGHPAGLMIPNSQPPFVLNLFSPNDRPGPSVTPFLSPFDFALRFELHFILFSYSALSPNHHTQYQQWLALATLPVTTAEVSLDDLAMAK